MSTTAWGGRIDQVRAAAENWASELIDLGFRNTLLHFKDSKTTTLDLTEAAVQPLHDLLAGRKVRLDRLVANADLLKAASNRARGLRKKALELEEEQGVEVARLAHGLLRVSPPAGRTAGVLRPLRAPLLLRVVTFHVKAATEADLALEVADEVEVNPVLLHALSREFGVGIDPDEFGGQLDAVLDNCADPAEQLKRAHDLIREISSHHGVTVELEERIVVGLFSYEKLPMYNDLRTATELLARHDVIAAMAGVASALTGLSDDGGVAHPGTDVIAPTQEFLVQDADSSQQKAINAALAGRHVVIQGPPGTGKSQTIANIIAGMAANGKRVLFVAEKRAAIEAVTQRLAQVDLDGLVFDLHQQKINKKVVAKQLGESLDRSQSELPPKLGDLNHRLVQRRQQAVAHPAELHAEREPWGMSAYQVQAELLEAPPTSALRFRGAQLRHLTARQYAELEQDLQDFVDRGGLRVRRGESPWSQAEVQNEDDVLRVLVELDQLAGKTLRRNQDDIAKMVGRTGLRKPVDLTGWRDVLELLGAVSRSVEAFGATVFGEHLDRLRYATATRSWRKAQPLTMGWRERRSLCKQVKVMSTQRLRNRRVLFAELTKVVDQRFRWRELAVPGAEPSAVVGLEQIIKNFAELRDQLAAVALCAKIDDLETRPESEVLSTIGELRDDIDTLHRMPDLNRLTGKLAEAGLGPLLTEVAQRHADSESARLLFRAAWLASLHDEFKLQVRHLAQFAGQQHSRVVGEFREADGQHVASAAHRVRYAVAGRVRQVRDAHPDQSALVRKQASLKSRHMPLRKLVEKAPDVLLTLRPCWAMSPLVVSRTLPPEQLFDLVIFDEASQIEPHDAVTSIMRGRQLVVAGDDKQLPPTPFFRKVLAGDGDLDTDEEESSDLTRYESILDVMAGLVPDPHMLRWHYRSRDERLIAFSNKEIYGGGLVTFPGAMEENPVRLEVVDGTAAPGQDGSAVLEVERVVELVFDHARHRPGESLGVITMGQKHLDRINLKLKEARREHPEFDDFFSDDAGVGQRFFVKNLERVQGDERDAIILSIGYAKTSNGRMPSRFGALNNEGGERRLNVAVTRAKKRMTVVSSFSHVEMDVAGAKNSGPELLRRFLQFAANADGLDYIGRRIEDIHLNGFESDVLRAMEAAGITVHPQWGVSDYRIDFALVHPEQKGRMVLAVETDGDSYHRSESARDRDRLRQTHLENLGWRFHRLWASDWFSDPVRETARIVESWKYAVEHADLAPEPLKVAPVPQPVQLERDQRPRIPRYDRMQDYSDRDLVTLCRWLLSDRLQLDRESRIDQALPELGFKKRGRIIVTRLNEAFDQAQRMINPEDF